MSYETPFYNRLALSVSAGSGRYSLFEGNTMSKCEVLPKGTESEVGQPGEVASELGPGTPLDV